MDQKALFLLSILSLTLALLSLLLFIATYFKLIKLRRAFLARFIKSAKKKLKKRYVVIRIVSKEILKKEEVEEAVSKAFIRVFGEMNYVKANPQLIYFDEKGGSCIVRVNHTYVRALLSVLWMINNINNKHCLMIPIKTTGTIRRAYRVVIRGS